MVLLLPPRNLVSGACDCRTTRVRRGRYYRRSDSVWVQRYLCTRCGRSSSEATRDPCYGQKKRQFNLMIFKMLTAGYSQRRLAMDLNLNRKTIVRKFIFLGMHAKEILLRTNLAGPKVEHMQFDDQETSVHSKLKPVSITLAVEHGSRRILGLRVSEMPAKGRLAKLSVKKYGRRKDERKQNRRALFEEIKPMVKDGALIRSDKNPHYAPDVASYFPNSKHETFKGRRACVVGQGELKRGGRDPLFSLNHTFAMIRANVNRLFRRTWCTTKRMDRLELHVALYTINHNFRLIKKPTAHQTKLIS